MGAQLRLVRPPRGAWIGAVLAVVGTIVLAAAAPRWLTLPAPRPLPAPAASGYVAHEGARIYYAAFGAGSPVILLHGGLASQRYWGNQVGPLVKGHHRVILIDSRGHGRSSRDERPYTYEL